MHFLSIPESFYLKTASSLHVYMDQKSSQQTEKRQSEIRTPEKALVLLDFLVRDLSQNILGSCNLRDSSKTVHRSDSCTRLDDSDSSSSMHKSDSFSVSPTDSWKNLYHNRGTEECEEQQTAKNCESLKHMNHYEPVNDEDNYPTANLQQPSEHNELQRLSEDNYSLNVNPSSSWNKMWSVNNTLECKEQRDAEVYKSVRFVEDRCPRIFTEEYPEGVSQQHTKSKKSQQFEHSVQQLHSGKCERYLQSENDAWSPHSENNVCPLGSKTYAQLSNSERHHNPENLPSEINMLMYDPNLHSENSRGDLHSKYYGLDKNSGSYNRDLPSENYDRDLPSGSYDRDLHGKYDRDFPSGNYDRNLPSGNYDGHLPSGNYDRNLPSESYDRNLPSGSYDRNLPSGSYDRNLPSGSYDRNLPSGSYDRNLPSGSYDRNLPSGNYDGILPSDTYDGHIPSRKYHRHPDSKKNDCQSNSENCGQNSENFARNMLSVNYDQYLLSQNYVRHKFSNNYNHQTYFEDYKQPKRLPKNGFLKSVATNIWSPIRKYFDMS
ncbi:hypothetical protein CDAR_500681 [Caerostris darwini]|uniref:Uncharacterized protein n=1 Tax=Caerostris darwini TaxID=1538125 RepID=A0AAV4V2X7_9ARAC|nr:hypothetical protein CDAR_500681 [Caerostris darwini]